MTSIESEASFFRELLELMCKYNAKIIDSAKYVPAVQIMLPSGNIYEIQPDVASADDFRYPFRVQRTFTK